MKHLTVALAGMAERSNWMRARRNAPRAVVPTTSGPRPSAKLLFSEKMVASAVDNKVIFIHGMFVVVVVGVFVDGGIVAVVGAVVVGRIVVDDSVLVLAAVVLGIVSVVTSVVASAMATVVVGAGTVYWMRRATGGLELVPVSRLASMTTVCSVDSSPSSIQP